MKKANFSKVFSEIYANHGKELDKMRKEVLIKECILIIALILLGRYILISMLDSDYGSYAFFIILIIIAIGLYFLKRFSRNYVLSFKQNVIRILVESQNDTYEYKHRQGLSPKEYNESGFDRSWDEFYSKDYIDGYLGEMVKFKMSQVTTIEEQECVDGDGTTRKTSVVTFSRSIWNNRITCY